ncbi:MAG: polysaccharide biosynthesis/export family protein [Proteobacteria bacterium]|nr:polysaccharide biosynthesis/export family protein [Pseudomonadota bacterium]
MVPPAGFTRLWFAAGLLLSLGACALPRSGPDYGEITSAAAPDLPFEVVRVTPAVTTATRIDERSGFSRAFIDARTENTATVAPGDVMAITVWENIDQGLLNPQGIGATPLPHVKVDERGFIFVPYIGLIRAAGRTLSQLREAIRARLAEMTLNPQVDVFPVDGQGRVVSVQGRVRTPGLYPIERPTERLLAMLARAGGVIDDPEVIRLKLRRGAVTGEIWVQDLYDDPANDVALRAGDALIAERDRRIFTALGAVGRPSMVPFPVRDLSAEQAIGAVGGLIDAAADPTGVFIFRTERGAIAAKVVPGRAVDGPRRIVYLLDLTQPGGMFLAREFIMRDGDTLYVTSAPFTTWMKILQSVAPLVTFSGSARTLTAF